MDEFEACGQDDELLQRWLDGELPGPEAAAVQRRLATDPAFAARARALSDLETWLRERRPPAPPDLAFKVLADIRRTAASRSAAERGRDWFARRLPARAWAPLAAALVLSFIAIRPDARLSHFIKGRPAEPVAMQPGASTPVPGTATEADSVRCLFELAAKDAHQVCLVGTFNRWKVCDTPLRPTPDGKWTVTMELPRGRYEYVFVVDGRWIADPAAPLRIEDEFGGEKAILLL